VTTLALLALAFLTVTAVTEHACPPPAGLIPLTRNEIARLTGLVTGPGQGTGHRLGLPLPAAGSPRSMTGRGR
jgi:hypothetical protein